MDRYQNGVNASGELRDDERRQVCVAVTSYAVTSLTGTVSAKCTNVAAA
jgi:hypothetical protein